jgi:ribosome-associated toxin RatA of RatAB toxin-antitoxin module
MRVVDRSAMVSYSAAQMYALVDDVEAYPEFLPWCEAAVLKSRTDVELVASLTIGYGPLNSSFTTCNSLQPPESMTMRLQDGPFSQLEGHWQFTPLRQGDGNGGCEVGLRVEFEFAGAMQDMLFGSTFENICNEMIGAFIKRADALYGTA